MLLFILSFILTALAGFFITSVIEQKNFIKIFIYMCVFMFAILIANIEILSLIKSISTAGILINNTILATVTGIIWYKKGHPIFHINTKRFFKKTYYAIMSDKYLLVLGIAFIFMLGVSIFLALTMPVVSADAASYHALRSLFWISNGSLNHFDIADIRALVMPINSEILYLWLFIFLKKQLFLGMIAFTGFLLSIFSVYGIMGNIGLSHRHKLWVIFIISSLPSVITQSSGTETDIIVAGLVLASIYLFWEYLKTKKISELFVSSLSFAIAIGTKTPALMMMFPVGIWMLWMGHKYDKEKYYITILKFLGFGFANFLVFSSYNYILNFLSFGCIFGPKSFLNVHNNLYGIKGAAAGFIKHMFMFFDFAGLGWNEYLEGPIINVKNSLLSILHLSSIPDGFYTTSTDKLNRLIVDTVVGLGMLGCILYLPCLIYSLIKPLIKRNKTTIYNLSFGLILIGSIAVMSYTIPFMTYNVRFFTSFCVVAAPILAYSYFRKNNILKFIFTLFALYGLLLISTHIYIRPFNKIINHLQNGYNLRQVRKILTCSKIQNNIPAEYNVDANDLCIIENFIRQYNKKNKFLYFSNHGELILTLKMLENDGYSIDYKLMENMNEIDLNKYDLIVIKNTFQNSTNIKKYKNAPEYSPVKDVNCIYLDKDNNDYIYQDKNSALHRVVCRPEISFFNDNNLKLEKNITIQVGSNNGDIYRFYRKSKK